MRYVVGYSANARGHDAVNLAVALARGRGASLDLVLVVPGGPAVQRRPRTRGRLRELPAPSRHANGSTKPSPSFRPTSRREAHIRSGESDAQTLIEAAEEFEADMLIIGATSSGLFKRFTIGSVASALLHASTVPVALAPHGYHRTEALTRVSCGLGTGPEPKSSSTSPSPWRRTGRSRCGLCPCWRSTAATRPTRPRPPASTRRRPSRPPCRSTRRASQLAAKTDVVVAQGRSIEEAVDRLDWEDGEVLLIGSSRLAQAPLHLPGQHRQPDPARPAGADDRGSQRLRTQAPEPVHVE